MNAFLTGSRAYGTPREDSDIDMVVLLPLDQIQVLWNDTEHEERYGSRNKYELEGSANCRFGNLNLICVSDPEIFDIWKRSTEELIARKPVEKSEAVELIESRKAKLQHKRNAFEAAAIESAFSETEDW